MRSDKTGAACETVNTLIFGDGMATGGSCGDPSTRHFTGKEHDPTGLDDFGARYYSSQFGRFVSADWSAVPAAVPYANLTNPQTLNLYAIVHDNPGTFADLDGHLEPGQLGSAEGMTIVPRMRPGDDASACALTGCDSHMTQWQLTLTYVDGSTSVQYFDSEPLAKQAGVRAGQNTGCAYDTCVTVTPKKSLWGRIGGWFSGVGLAIVRWGKLGGPLHRAGIDRVSRYLTDRGFKVRTEVRIKTPNGAKSARWVDVVGTRNGEVEMYQIGKQNQNGTPVAREVQALDDIEEVTHIRPNFVPYNIGDPNFGMPAVTDIAPGEGIAPGEVEVPEVPEIIPPE